MSFWRELTRRSVFQVAAAYCVVAWLLIQVASIVFPTFELPLWLLQSVIILAAIGFPVAVILAWIYDVTPEGVRRTDGDSGFGTAPTKTKVALACMRSDAIQRSPRISRATFRVCT